MVIDYHIIQRMIKSIFEKKGFFDIGVIEIDNCAVFEASTLSGNNQFIQIDYTIKDESIGQWGQMDSMNIKMTDYLTALRDYKIGDILK